VIKRDVGEQRSWMRDFHIFTWRLRNGFWPLFLYVSLRLRREGDRERKEKRREEKRKGQTSYLSSLPLSFISFRRSSDKTIEQ
jgi:hypothetical protein